jgi:hypothetical protein
MDNNYMEVKSFDLGSIVSLMRKRFKTLVLFLVFFVALGIAKTALTKKTYQVNFTFDSLLTTEYNKSRPPNAIEKVVFENMVNNFDNYVDLKAEANASYASMKECLKKVELGSVTNPKPSDKEPKSIDVNMVVYDTTCVKTLTDELISYINSNPFVINSYKDEKTRLLNLRNSLVEFSEKTNIVVYNISNEFLSERISTIDYKLKNLDKVSIINGPTCRLIKISYVNNAILFLLLGLIAGTLYIITSEKQAK